VVNLLHGAISRAFRGRSGVNANVQVLGPIRLTARVGSALQVAGVTAVVRRTSAFVHSEEPVSLSGRESDTNQQRFLRGLV